MFLVGMVALLLGSCTDSYDYSPAGAAGTEVYFDNSQSSTIEVDKNGSSFDIMVNRIKTDGELTVPLTFTPGEGNVFTVPSQVTFADGQATAAIHVTYNSADIHYGTYSGGTITLGGDVDTTYGIGSFTFKAGATQWVDFTANKSMGTMRDDAITSIFQFTGGAPTWNVHIRKSAIEEGMYEIVNPYEEWYNNEKEAADQSGSTCAFTYDASSNHEWVINAKDPDFVYLEECHTGMKYVGEDGYGEFSLIGTPYLIMQNSRENFAGKTDDEIMEIVKQQRPQFFGTLKDGVFTFPEQAVCIALAGLQDGEYLEGAKNGLFAVSLPGNVIADYAVAADYVGRFTDTNNQDYATLSLTLGADVASVKYALVSSTESVDATAQGIIDGSVASAEATASGNVNVAFGESGKYNLVCVIYNAAGESVGTSSFTFTLKSSKETEVAYKDIAAGTLTIGAKDYSQQLFNQTVGTITRGDAMEVESVLSQSTADATQFRLSPWLPVTDEKGNSIDTHLDFTVDADGNIYVSMQESGLIGQNQDGSDDPIVISDLISYFGGPDSQQGQKFFENGWGSAYNADEQLYEFVVLYHSSSSDGAYAAELDTYQVLDELEGAALKQAIAHAKKVAAERKYIFKPGKAHKFNMNLYKNYKTATRIK